MENLVINRGNPMHVEIAVLSSNGVVVELSRCTEVELIIWINGRSKRAQNVQVVSDILNADLSAAELDYLGEYSAQVKFAFADGEKYATERVYLFRVANEFFRTASGMSENQSMTINISAPLVTYDRQAVEDMINATQDAIESTANANNAAMNAEAKATLAQNNANLANAAATTANNSAVAADAKASLAQSAADNANAKATLAQNATTAANTATTQANTARDAANTARDAANTAATNANSVSAKTEVNTKAINELCYTTSVFNGTSSYCRIPSFYFGDLGDRLKFNAKFSDVQNNKGFAFLGDFQTNFGFIGISSFINSLSGGICLRTELGEFIYLGNAADLQDKFVEIEIIVTSTGLDLYVDNQFRVSKVCNKFKINVDCIGQAFAAGYFYKGEFDYLEFTKEGITTRIDNLALNYECKDIYSVFVDKSSDEITNVYNDINILRSSVTPLIDNFNLEYHVKNTFNGVDAEVNLPQSILKNIGDYLELDIDISDISNNRGLSVIGNRGLNTGLLGVHPSYGWTLRLQDGVFIELAPFKNGYNEVRLQVVESGWEFILNGISAGVYPKLQDFPIDNIGCAYLSTFFKGDIYRVKINANNAINEYTNFQSLQQVNVVSTYKKKSTDAEIGNLPDVILSYVKGNNAIDDRMYISTRCNNTNYYTRFDLSNSYSELPIMYSNQIRINNAYYNKYDGEIMQNTGVMALQNGESECVIMILDEDKADHTGGVHGDEQMIYVKYYVNGAELPESLFESSFTINCDTFSYRQKSTLHETAKTVSKDTLMQATGAGVLSVSNGLFLIDNVSTNLPAYDQNTIAKTVGNRTVSKSANNTWVINNYIQVDDSHEVIAQHDKFTTFKKNGYTTKNKLKFLKQKKMFWYHGICCVHWNNAKNIYNESFDEAIIDKQGGNKLASVGNREVYFYNNDCGAKVTSTLVKPNVTDNMCKLFIWDHASYSKYYRKTPDAVINTNDEMVSEMTAEFYYSKD